MAVRPDAPIYDVHSLRIIFGVRLVEASALIQFLSGAGLAVADETGKWGRYRIDFPVALAELQDRAADAVALAART